MADWHVGQKVVCVDARRRRGVNIIASGSLRKGRIYTVREVFLHEGEVGFRLNEIRCVLWRTISPRRGDDHECGFPASRFRPVVEPHADISVFTSILDGVNKREVVDA